MQAATCTSSSSSMRATGMPHCMMAITVSTASRKRGELAGGGRHRLRDAVQPHLDFGDDAQRAFRADEQPGQVVAGRGFADPPAGADHPAVGQSPRSGRARSPGSCRSARRWCRRRGWRTCRRWCRPRCRDRPGRTGRVAQVGVQLLARHPGLDAAVHVGLADVDDARHARQVEGDAAAHRGDVALQRGAGAPGHHRHAVLVAQREDAAGFARWFPRRRPRRAAPAAGCPGRASGVPAAWHWW